MRNAIQTAKTVSPLLLIVRAVSLPDSFTLRAEERKDAILLATCVLMDIGLVIEIMSNALSVILSAVLVMRMMEISALLVLKLISCVKMNVNQR